MNIFLSRKKKISVLFKDCLDNLKYRSQQHQNNDEVFRYNERYEERVRTTDKTAPRERVSELSLDQTRSIQRSIVNHF